MAKKISRRLLYKRYIQFKENPRKVALGFAVGIFVGMTPFFGLHMAISMLLAFAFKFNKLSALAGVQITNIFTAPFLYGFTYWVGAKTTGYNFFSTLQFDFSLSALWHLALSTPAILWSLIIGGFIVGLPISIFSYFAAYHLYRKQQKKIFAELKKRKKLKKAPAQ